MPLTVPSHGGLVAPLLLVDRGRLDGVALVVGATAPDLPYAWSRTGSSLSFDGHGVLATLLFSAPLAAVAAVVFRRVVARPLAVHLPDLGVLRLRDVAHAAGDRYPVWWSYACGALGATTHLLLDGLTHPEPWADALTGHRLRDRVDLPGLGPERWHDVLYAGVSVAGAVLVAVCLVVAGARRAREGVPRPALPRPTAASWLALVGPSALGLAAGGLAAAAVWGPETVAKGLTLLLWAATAGLVAGCAAAGRVLRL